MTTPLREPDVSIFSLLLVLFALHAHPLELGIKIGTQDELDEVKEGNPEL